MHRIRCCRAHSAHGYRACRAPPVGTGNCMMTEGRVLGVLGGMGPLASAQFMVRLTLLTPAAQDQEHIPTVLWSDPRVPPRTAARLEGGADPLPALLRGLPGVEAAGCGAIAVPCNTSHGEVAA